MRPFIIASLLASLFAPPAKAHLDSATVKLRKNVIAGARNIFSGKYAAGGEFFTMSYKETGNPKLHTLILITLRLTGDHKSALRFCMNNPPSAKRDHTFHYWCGRTYFDQGFQKSGLTLVKNAISLGGKLPHYLSTAAYMATKLGKTKEATGYLASLIGQDPWLLSSWLFPDYLTGIILTVEELFATFKYRGSLNENLAVFAWKAKHPDLADYYLTKAIKGYGKKVPSSVYELKVSITKVFDVQGRTRQELSSALKIHPDSVALLFEKATLLEQEKRLVEARNLVERLMKKDPYSVPILTRLGVLNIETGRKKAAHKYLSYAKARNAVHAEYQYGWGLYWQRMGKFDKARTFLKRARDLEPTSIKYLSAHLATLQTLGNKKLLIKEQQRLTNLKKFSKALTKQKEAYRRRFFKLIALRDTIVTGKTITYPAPCGLQCLAFKAYVTMKRGKKPALAPILSKLASANLLTPAVPLNGIRSRLELVRGKPLLFYYFFYSTRPSLFK